jgi:hypothetical protein
MALGGAMVHGASKGLQMARAAIDKSEISLSDFLTAFDEMRHSMEIEDRPYSTYNALTEGSHAALPGPAQSHRRNRGASPPPRPYGSSSSSSSATPAAKAAPAKTRPEVSFNTEKEWLDYTQSKTALVEELYKRPNWRDLVLHMNSKELRKKMGKLTRQDIATMLIALDV